MGLLPHPVPHLERLVAVQTERLGHELHMDVADPVGAALPLPHNMDIEVMQAVPVQLGHTANITLVHLLIGHAVLGCHSTLDIVPHKAGALVIGLEVNSPLECLWW